MNTRLAHQLPSAHLATVQVSSHSLWTSTKWVFAQTVAGQHARKATFDFDLLVLDETDELEEERLTSDRFAILLDEVRRFVHSLLWDSRGDGGHMKTSGISNLQTEIHFFLRWMASLGYTSIADLPVATVDKDFLSHLIQEKVRSRDEDALTDKAFAKYIAIPIKLHQQSAAMPRGVGLLSGEPFGGASAIKVAKKHARKAVQSIPALPMNVFLPVMSEALSWVTRKAWDVKRIHDLTMEAWNSDPEHTRGMRQKRAEKVLRSTDFETLPGETESWHPRITGTITTNWRSWDGNGSEQAVVGMFQQMRRLLMDSRDSSVALIQGLVALRISEVCGLKGEPFNTRTGLPACVVVEPTLNGIYDAFYITGRVYKGEDVWEDVRWAAGLRPRGTDIIPPAIRAVEVLYHVFKPYRDMAGLDDLVLGFSAAAGLPKSPSSVTPARSGNLNHGQQSWMDAHCAVPAGTEITTHMWRKTYAVQIYSADPSMLPAISQHFKHIDTQITYEGYIRGADPDLLMIVDEVSMSQDAEIFRDIRHGRLAATGGFFDMLIEGVRENSGYLDGLGADEEVEIIHRELVQSGIRSHQCGWGRCLYRPEWARCGGGLLGPSETGRSPSTCAGCANLLVLGEHSPFWLMRRESNQALVEQHLAAGDEEAALVPMDRVAQCNAMLGLVEMEAAHA